MASPNSCCLSGSLHRSTHQPFRTKKGKQYPFPLSLKNQYFWRSFYIFEFYTFIIFILVNYFHQSKSCPGVLMKEKKALHVTEALLATISLLHFIKSVSFTLPLLKCSLHPQIKIICSMC